MITDEKISHIEITGMNIYMRVELDKANEIVITRMEKSKHLKPLLPSTLVEDFISSFTSILSSLIDKNKTTKIDIHHSCGVQSLFVDERTDKATTNIMIEELTKKIIE